MGKLPYTQSGADPGIKKRGGGTPTLFFLGPPPASESRASPKKADERGGGGGGLRHIYVFFFLGFKRGAGCHVPHLNPPLHNRGHTIDLVFTRCDESLITDCYTDDRCISDHHIVRFSLQLPKPRPMQIVSTI